MELFLTFPSNLLSILFGPSIHNGLSRVDDFGLVRSDTAISGQFRSERNTPGTRRVTIWGGRCMINELSQRLLALHAGGIEKDFTPWVTDAVLARVLREGVVLRPDPRKVLYQIGAPLQCHANALNFELMGVKLVRVSCRGLG